jgi:MFS family permease
MVGGVDPARRGYSLQVNRGRQVRGTGDQAKAPISAGAIYVLAVMTLIYALNIADRFVVSTLIEPIKHEFRLSDGAVGFLTGVGLAIFYTTAGIPLGMLADRANRKRLIVWSLLAWSVLTALCGLSRTFLQLLVARIGVGVGEAGATPAQQSLLADLFPPRWRAMTMTVFALGAGMGSMMGASLGGWLNDRYGWRETLTVFGAIGVPIALLVLFTVREPRRGTMDAHAPAGQAGLGETLRYIWSHKALFHVLAGATVITFWGSGLAWWTPAFLTRSHELSVGQAGGLLGPMYGIGGTVVTLVTAWFMGAFGRRDARMQVWFLALTTFAGVAPSAIVYAARSLGLATAMLWIFIPLTYLYIGPTLGLIQNLAPAPMRAKTTAIVLFTANMANLAVAPQLIGLASDLLAPHLRAPQESLRLVLLACTVTGVWAAAHFALAARTLRAELVGSGAMAGAQP